MARFQKVEGSAVKNNTVFPQFAYAGCPIYPWALTFSLENVVDNLPQRKRRPPYPWHVLDLRISLTSAVVPVMLVLICTPAWAQKSNRQPQSRGDSALVTRGKYIVEGVACCEECHTPRNSQGELDRDRPLQGAPLWLQPAKPNGNWPLEAPRLAGIPPGSDEQIVKLLTTGIWRDGKPLRPPMPQFRMTPQDAQAVVAYLRSLNPSAQ
jgi:mono/diheme cytochrome c family protein